MRISLAGWVRISLAGWVRISLAALSASLRHTARPMPLPPPVTSATVHASDPESDPEDERRGRLRDPEDRSALEGSPEEAGSLSSIPGARACGMGLWDGAAGWACGMSMRDGFGGPKTAWRRLERGWEQW